MIPVFVLTGFLGAGKTTLLNRLLRDPTLSDTLVIVNEFGDVGLDHLLVERFDGEIALLSSGCLCCALRGDLVEALSNILARRTLGDIEPFARIIIETSGLADPAPVLHALLSDPLLTDELDAPFVVTIVDAVNGVASIDAHPECRRQIAVADRLVLSKGDMLPAERRDAILRDLTWRIRELNPNAPISEAGSAEVTARRLFAGGPADRAPPSRFFADQGERHRGAIRSDVLRWPTPVDRASLALFLDLVLAAHGPRLLRVKGLVALADDPGSPLVLHGAQHAVHAPARLAAWPDDDHTTRIVFITEGLEPSTIQHFWAALVGEGAIDAPDRAALLDNPLVAGAGGLLS
jgi:G3E family GTPase